MKTEIRSRGGQLSPSLREKVARRMAFALDHMASSIRAVEVRLSEEPSTANGAMRCDVTIKLQRGGQLHLSEVAKGPEQSAGRAADRVAQLLARHVDRRRRRSSESLRSVA